MPDRSGAGGPREVVRVLAVSDVTDPLLLADLKLVKAERAA